MTGVAVVALLGGGLALALAGGDDDDEVTTRTTRRDRTTTTEESADTTDQSPDTTDESPNTTDESADTTDEPADTTRPPLTVPPRPSTPPSTAPAPTEPPTTPPTTPAPPPPPSGPTQADLANAVLQGNDLADPSWSLAGDGALFPVCPGEELPTADLASGALFLNRATQQTVGNTVQSYADSSAAANGFAAWQQVFECPPFDTSLDGRSVTLDITELDFTEYGDVICDDEFLYFADYFQNGRIILRTLVAGERCGRNLSLWTFDEDISISPDDSLGRFLQTFNAPLSRFITLPQ